MTLHLYRLYYVVVVERSSSSDMTVAWVVFGLWAIAASWCGLWLVKTWRPKA